MPHAIDHTLSQALRGEAAPWPAVEISEAWERIQFHGIAGLLAGRREELADWPQNLLEKIHSEARLQALWEHAHHRAIADLIERLAETGIPALVMKGTALAYSIYANPSHRRRGDCDLLIRPAELTATRNVLRDMGLHRHHNLHGVFFQETWLIDDGIGFVIAVDLHWQVNDYPALQRVLPVEEFFASSRPLSRLSLHAAAPSPVLTFVQGAINQAFHGAREYYVEDQLIAAPDRLIWAMDNHLLAQNFSVAEWEKLVAFSVSRGVASLCVDALELAKRGFATPMPDDVIERLHAAPPSTDLAQHVRQNDQIALALANLAAIPALGDKIRFITANALSSRTHLRRKYPAAAHWPIALLQARRWAEGALRWAAGARA